MDSWGDERWGVTEVTDPHGYAYSAVGETAWQGPDRVVYHSRAALEAARGACTVTAVHGLHMLVLEAERPGEACDAHEAERKVAADRIAVLTGRVEALTTAARWASRALMGEEIRCGTHGVQFRPLAVCCSRPRDTARAREALDRALPDPPHAEPDRAE